MQTRSVGGLDRLLGAVPSGGGGVRIIVEALLSLLAFTGAIVKTADAVKIMRCYTLPAHRDKKGRSGKFGVRAHFGENSGSEHFSAHKPRGKPVPRSPSFSSEHHDAAGQRRRVIFVLRH